MYKLCFFPRNYIFSPKKDFQSIGKVSLSFYHSLNHAYLHYICIFLHTPKHIRIKRQPKQNNSCSILSNDKAAILFPTNAETIEAAAPYDNLHLQTKLEPLIWE